MNPDGWQPKKQRLMSARVTVSWLLMRCPPLIYCGCKKFGLDVERHILFRLLTLEYELPNYSPITTVLKAPIRQHFDIIWKFYILKPYERIRFTREHRNTVYFLLSGHGAPKFSCLGVKSKNNRRRLCKTGLFVILSKIRRQTFFWCGLKVDDPTSVYF